VQQPGRHVGAPQLPRYVARARLQRALQHRHLAPRLGARLGRRGQLGLELGLPAARLVELAAADGLLVL
jgi:hypothetical protein